ncbi:MAG: response regulator transcription factor [Pseudomonadota bacterium]
MHILIVEDDAETADFLLRGLKEAGDVAEWCSTVEEALLMAPGKRFDAIVFDRMLPDMDGINAVRLLRQAKVATPVIMLTAMSGIDDRVDGLDAGADDYMVKPFAFSELYARLKALLRRRQPLESEPTQLQVGNLQLDRTTQRVTRGDQTIDLARREYKILELLMQHKDEVVTRTMLLERVWGYGFDPRTSIVQTHVSRLRNKIDKPFDHELIKTVRGAGYVISE